MTELDDFLTPILARQHEAEQALVHMGHVTGRHHQLGETVPSYARRRAE